MKTIVTKNGCDHDCTTQQLQRFLNAGWKVKTDKKKKVSTEPVEDEDQTEDQ